MRNRANTIEEESFFPSITDLMVGIIFIFIIIVMALILQIKDEQQSIPKPLFEKIINLDQQKQTELDILIDDIEDIDQRIKDLANEKIKNIELREKLQKAEEKIQDQSDEINKKIIIELKNDKLIEELDLIKNEPNVNAFAGYSQITCPAVLPVVYVLDDITAVDDKLAKLLFILSKATLNGSPEPSFGNAPILIIS